MKYVVVEFTKIFGIYDIGHFDSFSDAHKFMIKAIKDCCNFANIDLVDKNKNDCCYSYYGKTFGWYGDDEACFNDGRTLIIWKIIKV